MARHRNHSDGSQAVEMANDLLARRNDASTAGSSSALEPGGRFSSILAYLDDVSENLLPRQGTRSASNIEGSSSTTSFSEPRRVLRPKPGSHRRQRGLQQGPHHDPEGDPTMDADEEQVRRIRAPWDNSTKQKTTTARNNRGGFSIESDSTTTVAEESSGSTRCSAAGKAARVKTPTPATAGSFANDRRHEDTSLDPDGNNPLSHRLDYSSGGNDRAVGRKFVDAVESTSAEKIEGTMTSGIGARRRWVWEEWGADTMSRDRSVHDWDDLADKATKARGNSDTVGRDGRHRGTPADLITTPGGMTAGSLAARHEEGKTTDACATPAARQAFEDVQATALAMRGDLKQRRSEVR